jgi:predicted ester cyclase
MSTEDNKALARRAYEVFNQRDLALVDELCAPEIVDHNASMTIQGLAAYKQFLSMYLTASPDLSFSIEDQVAEGVNLLASWEECCTFRGRLGLLEASKTRLCRSSPLATQLLEWFCSCRAFALSRTAHARCPCPPMKRANLQEGCT